jgi:hypothetical protein
MTGEPDGALSEIPWTARPAKASGLVTRVIAGETVVVPVRGHLAQLQNLYVLTPVGSHVWALMDGTLDLAGLHASILDAYDVGADQARADLLDFLRSMLGARLIDLTGERSGQQIP